jgi:hypothetical protein
MNFGIGLIVQSFTAGSFLLSKLGFTENHHLAFDLDTYDSIAEWMQ